MTVEEALPWLKEHGKELTDSIRQGKYKPDPVRRKEIPKPDGGVRKLGIPSVKDRIVQQGIAQVLTPIYEPLFTDGSYGYRTGRAHKMPSAGFSNTESKDTNGRSYWICPSTLTR